MKRSYLLGLKRFYVFGSPTLITDFEISAQKNLKNNSFLKMVMFSPTK